MLNLQKNFLKAKNYQLRISRGFTLIEVVVSMFVLTMGTLAIIGVISSSLGTIRTFKQSVVAANLAQEALEVVRNIRDSNWIEEEAYDAGLSAGEYCVDYNSISLSLCASRRLYWDGTKYSHNTLGDATHFFRTVSISNQVDAEGIDYIQISVIVDWDSREVTAENHLYDWK